MAVTLIPPGPFDMHHEDQIIRLHSPSGVSAHRKLTGESLFMRRPREVDASLLFPPGAAQGSSPAASTPERK